MNFNKDNKSKKYLRQLAVSKKVSDARQEGLENCICNRKRGLIFCASCQKSFMGRTAERCAAHPEVAYLMDARNCAFCGAAGKDLRMTDPI
ncbi:uncharacterized protein CG13380 [Drosophila grimshawi]|uniref:GH19691 n=1 Tax=Drosophila grimshawi TaxID=7222 RepID=B4JZX5_DROGR|nr:uncharacterized protein CG13380 [Drosophila grimshawi]EDV94265.1 GH19691 [Drosophila grimshawi]